MPRYAERTEVSEFERIIDAWILKNKTKSRRGQFKVAVEFTEGNESGAVTKDGEIFGQYFGLRNLCEQDKKLPWIVTHIPSGFAMGGGFTTRKAAVRYIESIINLGKWNFSTELGFSKLSASARGMYFYCAKRGVSREQFQAIINQIQKAGGV